MFMAIVDLTDDEVQATISYEICFQTQLDQVEWVLYSGFSHHMTGNKSLFCSFKKRDKGNVKFRDNRSSKIISIGEIGTDNNVILKKVLLVDNLKHNLLSISQICGEDNQVIFKGNACQVERLSDGKVIFNGYKKGNIYLVKFSCFEYIEQFCLMSVKTEDKIAWHRKLGHVSIGILAKLGSLDLVKGLPKLDQTKDFFCDACAKGKHSKSSCKSQTVISTTKCLELLHLDLFGPSNIMSLGGKFYTFVIVDDFSRYTWVYFLVHKHETINKFKTFVKTVQNEKHYKVISIRSDHGGEVIGNEFEEFCDLLGI
ncbi:Retrovirus-related Pol polyprotein from transposon TNT 1-94 [Linum grandiflorum]